MSASEQERANPPSRRRGRRMSRRANGEGTVYHRADGRWEGAGYVLHADGIRRRVRVYGATRKQAQDKLDALLADNARACPWPSTGPSPSAPTYAGG